MEIFKKQISTALGFGIIGLFILVIGTAFGGYYYFAYQKQGPFGHESTKPNTAQTVVKPVDKYADWLTYTNYEVGYSLRYPKNWTLAETSQISEIFNEPVKYISLTSDTKNTLFFGLKKTGDTFHTSGRTGVGAGDFAPLAAQKTTLLTAEIVPDALVYKNKTKEYFYNVVKAQEANCKCSASIWFGPANAGTDYLSINMAPDELPTVNLIMESVNWLPVSTENSVKMSAANFLNARKLRNIEYAKPFVTAEYLSATSQAEFAGTSSPSFGKYEITKYQYIQSTDKYQVTATIHWYLQGTESGASAWTITLVKQGDKYLVSGVKEN